MTEDQSYDPEAFAVDPETYAKADGWASAEVPAYYSDTINVEMGPYGLNLTFGIREARGPRPNARMHMSHQMALVLERILRRVLTSYEVEQGVPIFVPEDVLSALSIADSDMVEVERSRSELLAAEKREQDEDDADPHGGQ